MHLTVLYADDDPDDRSLARAAMEENEVAAEVHFVGDGEEVLDYLHRRRRFAGPGLAPRPDLILLDLNMPRKSGREAIREIKAEPSFRVIPIVVLTTSDCEEDIRQAYELGVSACIIKPCSFETHSKMVRVLAQYWFEVVALPSRRQGGHHDTAAVMRAASG